jgi:hypothetical protein
LGQLLGAAAEEVLGSLDGVVISSRPDSAEPQLLDTFFPLLLQSMAERIERLICPFLTTPER